MGSCRIRLRPIRDSSDAFASHPRSPTRPSPGGHAADEGAVFGRILVAPVIWILLLSVLLFVMGFVWPSSAEFVYKNAALNLGTWLGTIAIILSPFSKKCRSDFRADFDASYHRFQTGSGESAQQKQVEAAIKVASNLYLHTTPGAEDAHVSLQFRLPDSRYRYLIFCFSAMSTACASQMKNPDAVMSECLRFLVTWTATESVQEFFGGPVDSQRVANTGAAYLQEFLNNWSRYVELEKEGRNAGNIDLICSMIHTTESNEPAGKAGAKRLGELALQIQDWLPTMRGAFIELINS